MDSPSKQRLAMFLKKKTSAGSIYKPLQSLPRAHMFIVTEFTYKQSNYADSKDPLGAKPFILIPQFKFADTQMYTYLSKEYSSIEEDIKETVKALNEDISNGVTVKFAYYGGLTNQAKAKIHFENEDIDEKLLAEVKLWEKNEEEKADKAASPAKKPRFDTNKKLDFN